jgi:DNA-binding response OmpR family regulator
VTRRTVLVCDNETVLRALVRATLEPGYEVLEARDGDEALALMAERPPDLLLLDMMMPGRTGLDVLAELRAAGKTLPVVMVTARAQAADRVRAADAGADRFLSKPFSPAELEALVAELLA